MHDIKHFVLTSLLVLDKLLNMATESFSLRFRIPGLRAKVAEVAASEGLSQNELLEQAAQNEVIIRGGLIEQDLNESARVLSLITQQARANLIKASIAEAAAGEAMADPISVQGFEDTSSTLHTAEGDDSSGGVTAAFYNVS